jgi:pimeloyl-ACP methyl ester carboxylesterase
MAEDLSAFLTQHKIAKPYILGHSMGGKTAMEFAIQNPQRIAKLMVVDIAPVSYQVHHWDIIEALEAVDLTKLNSRKEADRSLEHTIDSFGVRQFLLKNLSRQSDGTYRWKFNLPALKASIEAISNWAISDGKFDVGTLFIKGEKSNYILPQYAKEIEKKFPNYHLEEIAGAGHWVHAEAPQAFKEAVDRFLAN